jgi:bifunctional UDP-N-acetylglucosamine pyrophosphorylase/glucosamine-1-phosphate N-acetyltransferase
MKNISKKAKISKHTKIIGTCKIGDNVVIYGDCYLQDCEIGNGTTVRSCCIISSKIGQYSTIGPYAHIRENSVIGDSVRIGNFVEIKKSTIGDCTKIAHLTYIGDCSVGKNCNFGCGAVVCNYDGKQKHKTEIGNNVFIGSNVNLIAPIKIDDNSFIAAGSTVTEDVPQNTFVIARAKQQQKPKRG